MESIPQIIAATRERFLALILLLLMSVAGAADGHIEITLEKEIYLVGDIIRGTATAIPDGTGYTQPNIDGTITVSINPSLVNAAPPVYGPRSTTFSYKSDSVRDYVITASSMNSGVTSGRKVVIVQGALDLTANKTVLDYGSIVLGDIDTAKLDEIRAKIETLTAEITAIGADGEISSSEQVRINAIKNELSVIRAQLRSHSLPTTSGSGTSPVGTVTIQVTGTNGQSVTLSLSEAFTSAKYGTGFGDKLGSLSQTTGVIPFSATFTPSGNYGTATIEGRLDSTSALTDSVAIIIKGQSEESARQLESTRYSKRTAEIETFENLTSVLLPLLAGGVGALLASLAGITLILSLLGLAVIVAAIAILLVGVIRRDKADNNRVHRGNLLIIELLPEIDPPAGTENNTDTP